MLLVAMVLQIPALRVEAVQSEGQVRGEFSRQVAVPIVAQTQHRPKRQGELPRAAGLVRSDAAAARASAAQRGAEWTDLIAARRPPVGETSLPPPCGVA